MSLPAVKKVSASCLQHLIRGAHHLLIVARPLIMSRFPDSMTVAAVLRTLVHSSAVCGMNLCSALAASGPCPTETALLVS